MDNSSDIVGLIAIGVLLLGIFAGCAIVIKRFWVDKKYSGGQFIGREVYRSFQSRTRQNAIEEVEYIEDVRRTDQSGRAQ